MHALGGLDRNTARVEGDALPNEAERYGRSTARRLLVKPGITGLWQVSGRSDLSWEESVRRTLDIYRDVAQK